MDRGIEGRPRIEGWILAASAVRKVYIMIKKCPLSSKLKLKRAIGNNILQSSFNH
jgi:hypothetical protein